MIKHIAGLLIFAAATFPSLGCKSDKEIQQQQREAARTAFLEKGFKDAFKDHGYKKIQGQLMDQFTLSDKSPEMEAYRKQLTSCEALMDKIVKAGDEKRYGNIPKPLEEGFMITNSINKVREDNVFIPPKNKQKYAANLAVLGTSASYTTYFISTMALLASGPRDVRREALDLAAKMYPVSTSNLTRIGLGKVIQEAYRFEEDGEIKTKLDQIAKQYQINLEEKNEEK